MNIRPSARHRRCDAGGWPVGDCPADGARGRGKRGAIGSAGGRGATAPLARGRLAAFRAGQASVARRRRGAGFPGRQPDASSRCGELPGDRGRRRLAGKLRHRLRQFAEPDGAPQFARLRHCGYLAGDRLRGADRVGGIAHRHAGQGVCPRHDPWRLHHALLSRGDRLDPARRTELGMAQPRVDGAQRRHQRSSEHLQLRRCAPPSRSPCL